MRKLSRFTCIFIALILMVSLVGFSEGATSTIVTKSSGQAAAAVFVQQWGQILWGLVMNQTGTQTPEFGDPIFNPDGSVSQSYTAADGTSATLTTYMDGSARIDITLPNGTTQVVLQSVPVFDWISKTTIDWSITSSDGLSVQYTSVVDDMGTWWDISDDTTELTGSATLPGGLTQTFEVLTANGQTDIESIQSDGSVFTMSVPLKAPDYILPDFSQSTTGTYISSLHNISFTIVATSTYPNRWAAMRSIFGPGSNGQFAVYPDFSGYGQIYQIVWGRPRLQALLKWSSTGTCQIYLMTRQRYTTGPAGAARDFLQHRWQTLSALFAPSPGL